MERRAGQAVAEVKAEDVLLLIHLSPEYIGRMSALKLGIESKRMLLFGILLTTAFASGYAWKSWQMRSKPATELKKVTGIGGIFFKSRDPKMLRAWYAKNLGLQVNDYGSVFEWYQGADSTKKGFTQWSLFKETTHYFEPSTKDFMVNYRVADLDGLMKELRANKVSICDSVEVYDYGKFVHILDPEGNKIELWEPNDVVYEKMGKDMGAGTTK